MDAQHSLAHELAAALMPEPSAGSKLLAEEFGIDFDEGAEGIDEAESDQSTIPNERGLSFADELNGHQNLYSGANGDVHDVNHLEENMSSPSSSSRARETSETDPMGTLLSNLDSTDQLLEHLRQLDAPQSKQSGPNTIEVLASSIIRRLNEASREREGQVRALLGYEREFRKIASEIGGGDILAQVDAFEEAGGSGGEGSSHVGLETLDEEPETPTHKSNTDDWEKEEDSRTFSTPVSPASRRRSVQIIPPPPPDPSHQSTTSYVAQTVPHLAYARILTSSVLSSVSAISELCQINGAGTADAGRKIRALKTKIVEWRADADLADQSMKRIEKWESRPDESSTSYRRRVDGRKVVQEQLVAFEGALSDATNKTLAIMAGA